MRTMLNIAAGIVMAYLVISAAERYRAYKAIEELNEAIAKLPEPAPAPRAAQPTKTHIAVRPPTPPPVPRYPFPDSRTASVGATACMNGITLRHEPNGWTQVSGTTNAPTCEVSR